MAKAKVTYADDLTRITLKGDPKNPEPSTVVVDFPGGHVEIARCQDNTYWAHIYVVDSANILEGRIDRPDRISAVEKMEDAASINHMAIRVSPKTIRKIG